MAVIGHVRKLPGLKTNIDRVFKHLARSRKVRWSLRFGQSTIVLGILVFSFAPWSAIGHADGQAQRPDRLSNDQLMARDCRLNPQQVVVLVEEQLTKSSRDGSLSSTAEDALVQSLAGCTVDANGMLAVAQDSKYFNEIRSSKSVGSLFITIIFSKKERPDDFNFVFNVCTEDLGSRSLRCKKNQIIGVATFRDVHRWP